MISLANRFITLLILSLVAFTSIAAQNFSKNSSSKGKTMNKKFEKSEKEWKEILTPEEYKVLREKGTEHPFTGKYWNAFEVGVYKCAACQEVLFDSQKKFDAGCGWPSFSDIISSKNIITKDDLSYGMHRIEVMCAGCGGHLGHVFDDGPKPTGIRYCINSISIKFEKRNK
ncbi:MAG: peptide-methionine (R)-S-oxide reductase [Ignavibacteria bacterium]|nr:MAG: peptide-methionine (R)-S-oxide reductase [Ignavibacteria bacterium]KAF0161100.1 MAG: peptide-methionine (R)-S-oxide reductase [Ignavibacteria bacterium]